jgi:hypothetical protein
MRSISSVSTASSIANLMQMLKSTAPPAVSSLLGSSKVQAALAKAPPADVVQLSEQAMQLQMADALFGTSSQTNPEDATMASLFAPIVSPSSSSTDATSQMEDANLAQQSVLSAIYTASGYGASQSATSASGSLVNMLA